MTAIPAPSTDANPPTLSPNELKPHIDVYGRPLTEGSRVRIYDFGLMTEDGRLRGHDTEGPYVSYFEGHLRTIDSDRKPGLCPHYTVDGETEVTERGTREFRQTWTPPHNGTRTNLDRYTCAVVRCMTPITRCETASAAIVLICGHAADGLYLHRPDVEGDDARARRLLRRDLEVAFGFIDSPRIPEQIRAKAFQKAEDLTRLRLGYFDPSALVEDYAEFAEILNLVQDNPIRFQETA